jgi:hypothetical protein
VIAELAVWHASVLEMVWTLIGLIGMYFGISNLHWSNNDLRALKALNGGNVKRFTIMRVIAFGHWRNDLFRLMKQLTITVIGVIAMILPTPPRQTTPITPVGVLITGGLFTISILIVMASVLDRRQREALEELDEREHDH